MPVMDGYTATRALRQQAQWRDLPVIAMTANAMVGHRDKVLAAGMNDQITKPIRLEEMFATLARWVHPAVAESCGAAKPMLDLVHKHDGTFSDGRFLTGERGDPPRA